MTVGKTKIFVFSRRLCVGLSVVTLLGLLALSSQTPVHAQISSEGGTLLSAEKKQDVSLKGLAPKDISSKLGLPDSKRSHGDGRESWVYGDSIIFFQNDSVTAWSDAGDLSARENLAAIRSSSKSDYELFSKSWRNVWTPAPAISLQEALDGLVGREDGREDGPREEPKR